MKTNDAKLRLALEAMPPIQGAELLLALVQEIRAEVEASAAARKQAQEDFLVLKPGVK
jgi:hypothetical protein